MGGGVKHGWCFTIHLTKVFQCSNVLEVGAPPSDSADNLLIYRDCLAKLEGWCFQYCSKYAVQAEYSETKALHLQGMMNLKTKKRFETLQKAFFPEWAPHLEASRNTNASFQYCMKEESRATDSFKWSLLSKGLRQIKPLSIVTYEALRPWAKEVVGKLDLDNYNCWPEVGDRRVFWYWDKKGGCGKTLLTKYLFDHCENQVLVASGKATDCMHLLSVWLQKYGEGPRIVILDAPRQVADYISYQAIEKFKDGLATSGKYEGQAGMRFNVPWVIVLANQPPKWSSMSGDRWEVFEIDAEDGSIHHTPVGEEVGTVQHFQF